MRIVTLRYLKQNAATLDVNEPLIVTQNGQPAYVIESYDDRIRRDESIALLTLMTLSEQDLEQGRTFNRKVLLDSL
ncbi:type II toxin-antitoxin system Phd/YefM family antitoxin [Serratia proteamaculans]